MVVRDVKIGGGKRVFVGICQARTVSASVGSTAKANPKYLSSVSELGKSILTGRALHRENLLEDMMS